MRGSHLPVGHSNNVAVHPVNTGLVYHPLHSRDEHLAPLQTETLLGRKLLCEKLLESGEKRNALLDPHELRSKTSQKVCACVFTNVEIVHTEGLECYTLGKYLRQIKRNQKNSPVWQRVPASRTMGHRVRTLYLVTLRYFV